MIGNTLGEYLWWFTKLKIFNFTLHTVYCYYSFGVIHLFLRCGMDQSWYSWQLCEYWRSFMCEFSVVDITRYSTLIGISLLTTHNSLILIYKVVKIWNVLLLNINIRILPNNIAFNQSLKKYHGVQWPEC